MRTEEDVTSEPDDPALPLGLHAALWLPAEPRSAAAGRRFIAKTLAGWGLEAHSDTAVLLANELVTNALLHARSAVELELTCVGSTLRVAVHDTAVAAPARRFYGLEAGSGRGLAMVEALSADWGVILRPPVGKTVWFELRLPNGEAPARPARGPAAPDRTGSPYPTGSSSFPSDSGPARPAGAGAGASH